MLSSGSDLLDRRYIDVTLMVYWPARENENHATAPEPSQRMLLVLMECSDWPSGLWSPLLNLAVLRAA